MKNLSSSGQFHQSCGQPALVTGSRIVFDNAPLRRPIDDRVSFRQSGSGAFDIARCQQTAHFTDLRTHAGLSQAVYRGLALSLPNPLQSNENSLPNENPARRLNRALEALVRECPGQYLWGYNRYKTPRGAKPKPT